LEQDYNILMWAKMTRKLAELINSDSTEDFDFFINMMLECEFNQHEVGGIAAALADRSKYYISFGRDRDKISREAVGNIWAQAQKKNTPLFVKDPTKTLLYT
jgi:hypothetical protein